MSVYITTAEIVNEIDTENSDASFISNLEFIAEEATRIVEQITNRWFDHRVETLTADPKSTSRDGDVDGRFLIVRDDLQSINTITFPDGTVVPSDSYRLLPVTSRAKSKSRVEMLDTQYSWVTNVATIAVPYIYMTGIWGWGGEWTLLGSLAEDMSDSTVSMDSGSEPEYGKYTLLRIDDEYMQMETPGSPSTVRRGINGSDPAEHTSGTPIYRFIFDPYIRRIMKRLCVFIYQQQDNPVFQQVVMGDNIQMIDMTLFPKDIRDMLQAVTRLSTKVVAS